MSGHRVVVTVDRLVVTGLSGGAPGRVSADIRDALAAALAGLEVPAGLSGDAVVLPALTLRLPAGAGPGQVGPAVAEALAGALAAAGRDTAMPAETAPSPPSAETAMPGNTAPGDSVTRTGGPGGAP